MHRQRRIDAPNAAIVAESLAKLEQAIEKVRVALLDVTHDLLNLARRGAGASSSDTGISGQRAWVRTWRKRRHRGPPARGPHRRQSRPSIGRAAGVQTVERCRHDRQRGRNGIPTAGLRHPWKSNRVSSAGLCRLLQLARIFQQCDGDVLESRWRRRRRPAWRTGWPRTRGSRCDSRRTPKFHCRQCCGAHCFSAPAGVY